MKSKYFLTSKTGTLAKTAEGAWAFVPAPLPPEIPLSWEFVRHVSEADRALSELAGVARMLPNPHLMIQPFIRREAVLSSRIEGTQASLSELFTYEAVGAGGSPKGDVVEVANYVVALEYGLERLSELPISLRLIKELHEKLMRGVRGQEFTPGEFRRHQNWIGPPGCSLLDATYVPPPLLEMESALSDMEKYLHSESPLPPLVRLALVHYQFEAIHPFLDGNGRIGRLLITLLLCSEGLLSKPLLYLSAFFEKYRREYYQLLLDVSQRGAWQEWVTFFLRGVAEQSRDAGSRANQLLQLWQSYRGRLHKMHATGVLLALVDMLFSSPVLSVGAASKQLNVTFRTAQLQIDKLVAAGILREVTGRQRNRVFMADEVLRTVERS